jgi:hypothetical protein
MEAGVAGGADFWAALAGELVTRRAGWSQSRARVQLKENRDTASVLGFARPGSKRYGWSRGEVAGLYECLGYPG